MAGFTIGELREALAAQLRANIDRSVNVRAYPPASPSPSILIELEGDAVDYWMTYGAAGVGTVRFLVTVDPSGTDAESSARRLDEFLSVGTGNGSSFIDAVLVDKSLGLDGVTCNIRSAEVDSVELTAQFVVEVHVNKVGAAA